MLFLDIDPVICANNTPISLYEHILQALGDAFTEVETSSSCKYKSVASPIELKELFVNDILLSKNNRNWLITYHNILAYNLTKITGRKYPPRGCEYVSKRNIGEYFARPLELHKPIYDKRYLPLILENSDTYAHITDAVELSRAMLIHLKPSADEFPFGEPAWLNIIEYRDYVAFDPIQKLHIKIVRTSDGYRYYTSKISNNWKEIECVPPEMDKIIDCILVNKV